MNSTPRQVAWTPHGLIALGFGSGLSPFAPGTAGTAAAMLPMWLLSQLPWWALAVAIGGGFVVGLWACGKAGRDLGVTDHGAIVWDEFLGLWVTLALVPFTVQTAIVAFFVFRFFDILKPWPVRWFERQLPGALGVMADDLMAGVYAGLVTFAVWRWLL